MLSILNLIANIISLYSFICLIRIVLTWFPRTIYSPFGQIISKITDPFLNFFKQFKIFRFRNIDFSATIAICFLLFLANIIRSLAYTRRISLGYLLANIVSLCWSLINSFAIFILVLLLIRLIAFLLMRFFHKNVTHSYNSYGSFWDHIDRIIHPFVFKISSFFSKKIISYTWALTISFFVFSIGLFISNILIRFFIAFLISLPF